MTSEEFEAKKKQLL
ncbi:hypothetical protein [Faecalicatena contorta]